MRFTKADILEAFDRQGDCYLLAILAQHWLRGGEQFTPSAIAEARNLQMESDGGWVSFEPLAAKLSELNSMYALTGDFLLNQLHALIRTPFELLDDYCADHVKLVPDSDLRHRLKQANWYPFARIIRNAVSHNFHLDFGVQDRKLLPVTWSGVTITVGMSGQKLTGKLFNNQNGYRLHQAMRRFAAELPELPARPHEGGHAR